MHQSYLNRRGRSRRGEEVGAQHIVGEEARWGLLHGVQLMLEILGIRCLESQRGLVWVVAGLGCRWVD